MNNELPSRRDFLYGLGSGLGSVALTALLANELAAAEGASEKPLAPKAGHFPAKAKACIFLMMEGGPSHIDTFDPKPKLKQLHRQVFNRGGEQKSAMESGKRYYVESPFEFHKAGKSGADISKNWRRLSAAVDDICFYRGCQVDSVNHPTAMYQMNTGSRFGGDPAVGAWTTYGLGSENEDLPGFVVLPEVAHPQGGSANWSNGYLPAHFQGAALRPQGSPIHDLQPPPGIVPEHQRANLDLLRKLNQKYADTYPRQTELAARLTNYEQAFRMQREAPELLNLAREPQRILDEYGVGKEPTDKFARRCLLARRLVQQGVRFVQMYAGTWDSHDYIARAHASLIEQVDRPIAALLADLKRTGLLDETLVVWCGEFGRSPDNGVRGGIAYGRDHNPHAMTIWMAGGGVRGGSTVGATDETGAEAVECVHHVRDLHVTLLRLLGLDDNKLTFFHGGRYKQLSQFGGQAIGELIG
jgi:hypothetical protein